MKIIFLDIDGVLNSTHGKGPYVSDMEIEKLTLLKRLLDNTNSSGVVITSDRRFSKIDMKNKFNVFSQYQIDVLGKLRLPNDEDHQDNRGKQINDYLLNSNEEIEKIVILDDNDDGISNLFYEDFILVNKFYGLNNEIYEKALRILM